MPGEPPRHARASLPRPRGRPAQGRHERTRQDQARPSRSFRTGCLGRDVRPGGAGRGSGRTDRRARRLARRAEHADCGEDRPRRGHQRALVRHGVDPGQSVSAWAGRHGRRQGRARVSRCAGWRARGAEPPGGLSRGRPSHGAHPPGARGHRVPALFHRARLPPGPARRGAGRAARWSRFRSMGGRWAGASTASAGPCRS